METLEKELKEKDSFKKAIIPVVYSYKSKRDSAVSPEERKKEKDILHKIKEYSIEHMKELKEKTIAALMGNGIRVITAKDSEEARNEILKIIGKERLIIKAKSNVASEIGISKALRDKEMIETDLGDFIVQVFDEDEMHPVLPSIHLTPEKIAQKMNSKFSANVKPDKEEIVAFVRGYLREKIVKAKVGITGANAITADGSIVVLENEGNISLVSRIPDKHIIISSFDKIVPTLEDALHVVRSSALYGTGQKFPAYVSIISSPSKTADIQNEIVIGAQGAKEVYLVLVDNGRSEILNSDFRELLYCINCGACLNFCPVYHNIARRYGSKYLGAKGVIFSMFDESPKDAFSNGAFFCAMCKACSENCPSGIDLPLLMKKLRQKLVSKGIEPPGVAEMIKNVEKFGNPFGEVKKGEMPGKLYCC
jgi:iron-sulfur cluster protein